MICLILWLIEFCVEWFGFNKNIDVLESTKDVSQIILRPTTEDVSPIILRPTTEDVSPIIWEPPTEKITSEEIKKIVSEITPEEIQKIIWETLTKEVPPTTATKEVLSTTENVSPIIWEPPTEKLTSEEIKKIIIEEVAPIILKPPTVSKPGEFEFISGGRIVKAEVTHGFIKFDSSSSDDGSLD